ncbi:acyclic terpene utilization AtuA family protein [Pseudaquabacterium rugosum]|uniref:Acyclic terpene utilization AtuA family protein n=1 Tax=Pseudaquabacterium rugosum TaxID=2984194 RepID=A0ABU9BCK9_9BURK
MSPPLPLHIGAAAGFSGDRTDAARPVVDSLLRRDGARVLIFETLAERTLALAQQARRADPQAGYEPLLDALLRPVLADCLAHGIRIVSNFGAAHPQAAAARIRALAAELGLRRPRIAVVSGDDLSDPAHHALLREALATAPAFDPGTGAGGDAGTDTGSDHRIDTTSTADRWCADDDAAPATGPHTPAAGRRAPTGRTAPAWPADAPIVSANVYLGAEGIAEALRAGVDIVVTGRVADPALVLGPALAHFGWAADDWDRLAGATMAGHLLECGAQVCGGYYADPGYKDVPGLARVGFPLAELFDDGSCIVGKAEGTGGRLDLHTVTEQLLYELHDPGAYLTPDVVADIRTARLEAVGTDRVRLSGVCGHPRPATLKANVFRPGGWMAEGEISYAGPGAEARARLAGTVLRERLADLAPLAGDDADDPAAAPRLRLDLIGVASVLADDGGRWLDALPAGEATDVRLRAATRQPTRAAAERLTREVTALYTCGPAGGGGVRTALRERLATASCLLPRAHIHTRVEIDA